MPGSLPTIDRRLPVMRLNSADFPTLGRPTMTTVGGVERLIDPHDSIGIRAFPDR